MANGRPVRRQYLGETKTLGSLHLAVKVALGCFCQFTILVDNDCVDDWDDWIENREGAKDTFLFKAQRTQNKAKTGLTLTGTVNGVNKVFTITHKFIDAASVTVYRNGAPDASVTLSLNNTTPTITYVTAPSSSATIDFVDDTAVRAQTHRWVFEVVRGTADQALDIANRINIHPVVRY